MEEIIVSFHKDYVQIGSEYYLPQDGVLYESILEWAKSKFSFFISKPPKQELWFIQNEDFYYSEQEGQCIFKSSVTPDWDKAHDLWTRGERLIWITTNKGFILTIDYFPSIRTLIFGNGYYELSEENMTELNTLLGITE